MPNPLSTHQLLLAYVYHSHPLEQLQLLQYSKFHADGKGILMTANYGQIQS